MIELKYYRFNSFSHGWTNWDKSNHDGTEDIIKLEIVSTQELRNMIKERKIKSAGTLIAYLICCTSI